MTDRIDIKAIADALGISKRAAEIKSAKESWSYTEKAARGGQKRLYPLSSLPMAVREAFLRHTLKSNQPAGVHAISPAAPCVVAPNTTAPFYPVTLPVSHELKDWQRKTAEARSAIINEIKRLSKAAGMEKAIQAVIALAANNELPGQLQRLVPVANAKAGSEGKRHLSRTSIYRWMKEAEQGFAALAPKANDGIKVPAWAAPLLAMYQQPQKPTLKKCLDDLVLPEGVSAPSYWAAQRFIDKMSKLDLERGRMLPRELKNVRAFVRRDTSHMWPGDCYTSDGHKFDAEIAHPKHGRPFRPEITTVLDVATRRCVGWSVNLAESTWAVLDAQRHAVERYGINALHYVDNGSGQKNELMSDEVVGFMARLGITLTHSLPYNSQARGLEERSHQTIWVRGAKELPTYMGASMDREARQAAFRITRKDINAVGTSRLLMQFSDFLKWCDLQVETYNSRPHRALPKIADPVTGRMRHQSPKEAWEAAQAEGWEPVMLKPGESADLFRPYKIGKTHRAEVRLFGNIYFNRALEHYHGEQVRIGYDIHDGSRVWVRDLEGRLICEAEFEANKQAYFPQSQIDVAARRRAEGRIKRAEAHIEEAEAELNPPLVIEHQQAVTLPTFDFKAPAQELRLDVPIGVPAMQAEALPENAAYLPVPRPVFATDSAKYRWLQANASQITDEDNKWLDYYCSTSEWEDLFGEGFEVAAG